MFTLGVKDHVMIAHSFADPFFGPAQRLHGATYAVEVEIVSETLGPHHVVMDIGALQSVVRQSLESLNYRNLDEHPAFPGRTSTTERVAEFVGREIHAKLQTLDNNARPPSSSRVRVTLHESPVAYARFEV